ncbi:protein SMAX1-LIKE 4-like [Phragmites australis]|uniref:protein SMAX1-LIKE 4-like n=1 Tax=Phragmites australis TaxID=29695 RepID=UPI002D78E5A5|nr:protein SMAX1-LIKE 4-like [Phragmites australis]
MRAGGYTVHQSLTAEAAAVLKLSSGLARRRGHAQVTPLHVAFTLLSSSASSSPLFTLAASPAAAVTPSSYAYGLLRRACAKAHPGTGAGCSPAAVSQPLRCPALELCLNVALNRLPTANAVGSPLSSPSSSSASSTSFAASLVQQPNPTLSNALVAALKRAQTNQRRGCVELQSQPLPLPQQQGEQQQPLLTIKVELDQLIVSILDDPSVSRVMREAGFSSAAVKSSLEEESAMVLGLGHHHGSPTSSSSPAPSAVFQSQFLLEPYSGFPTHPSGCGMLWPAAQFLNQPDVKSPCKEEDVTAILEVMLRKQGRRTNPVVVGDSASVAEASVAELMRRLERGDVPDEMRGAPVLWLHLSHVHVRVMTRADVDAWVADLRRSVAAGTSAKAGLVIYVGDMHWAVDHDDAIRAQATGSFSPAEHMAAEMARLLGDLRAAARGRVWLVAAASYQTYMRCQRRRALEVTWALQPVAVPAGAGTGLGLALDPPAASSTTGAKIGKLARFPLLDLAPKEEDGVLVFCPKCARNYEMEASAVRAKAEGTNLALTYFPGWPQADEPQTSHKVDLMDLKRKWTRLCQRVHLQYHQPTCPSNATSSAPGLCLSFETPTTSKINHQAVKTTLSLLLPCSAETSDEVHYHRSEDMDANLAAQEPDAANRYSDTKSTSRLWLDELPSGDLKRKADTDQLPGESKRWRGSGGLDLNLCADGEEDGGSSSEDEPVPSDLTNDGESSGVLTDSHDSHS